MGAPIVTYRSVPVADGINVFCREAGDPAAPVLLLLHGFPTSSHMFRDLIPLLADRYRVIAPDLPGFGQTTTPPGFSFTFDALAKVIRNFTHAAGLDRFALYVFDYGAPVGFRLAMAEPERITALITQNGNAYEEGLSSGWDPIRAYWRDPSQANRDALRALLTPETTRWQYAHGADEARLSPDGYTLDSALLARPGQNEVQLDLFRDYATNVALYPHFQRWLRERRPPVLAVWGKNDPFFSPPGAEAFKRDVPDAEVHFFDAGHFALETHADEIATAIRGFLARKLGTAAGGAPSPADVVRSFYAALGRGDVPGVLALLHSDVEWTEAERFPYYAGTWHGPEAVRDNLLARLAQDWDGFSAKADDYLVEGNRVVSLGAYAGTHKRTGRSMTAPFAHLWTVRGARIGSFTMYTDTAKVLEAMQV